jgi:hypothetical protein
LNFLCRSVSALSSYLGEHRSVPEAIEVTPEIKAELEQRLKELEANPEAGYSWEQVKSHLRNGTWRSG